jgi:hypothetical protein
VIDAAVAVKVPVAAPAATATDAGTVRAGLLEESVTAAPPDGAVLDSVTVQVEVPPETTADGAHCNPVTVTRVTGAVATVIVPPAPVTAAAVPSDSTPITFPTARASDVPVPVGESATLRFAIDPEPMAFAFSPDVRQVSVPVPALQDSVLPAAVSAGPAEGVTETISLVGKVNVHCTPTGAGLPGASDSDKETVPP